VPEQLGSLAHVPEGTLILHADDARRLVVVIGTSKPPAGRVDEDWLVDLASEWGRGSSRAPQLARRTRRRW
jgi:hypothetical protein